MSATVKSMIAFNVIIVALLLWACSDSTPSPTAFALSDQTDIQYGINTDTTGVNVPLMLDLYYPSNATTTTKYPLVVMIHGGSYISGDKSDMKGNSELLADSGFVVASINYRMGWRDGTGDCDGDPASQHLAAYRALQDSNAALRYLVANAQNLGIDVNWIFIGGNSAGSSLSLNTSYIPEEVAKVLDPQTHDLLGPVNTASNALTNSFTIKGICNMWGALPDSTLINSSHAYPMIGFHGTSDTVVPYDVGHNQSCDNFPIIYGSLCMHRQLVAVGISSLLDLYVCEGHGPKSFTHQFMMRNTACFFKKIIHSKKVESIIVKDLTDTCQ